MIRSEAGWRAGTALNVAYCAAMSSNPVISASYGVEDRSLGIKFTQVKARGGDIFHAQIEALTSDCKCPQLVRDIDSLSMPLVSDDG